MQGFDREDVAAKAIAYKQQRGSVNQTKVFDNLERTDYILARNCLALIQQYYTEPRIVNITHLDVTREPEEVQVNQEDPVTGQIVNDLTLGEYDITVTSSPYRASIEDSQFEQARALREIGVPIPDSVLIENSRLMRRAEIVKQMQGDQESPEAQKQRELEMRGKEAEVAGLEGDAQLKHAQAQKTQAEAQTAAQGDGMAEIQKMQAELQMERERLDAELQAKFAEMQMKMEEMQMKLQMKGEEHQMNMAVKQQEAAQNAQIREEDAAAKRAMMLRQQAESGEEAGEQQSNVTA
jgi:hypothetical protein